MQAGQLEVSLGNYSWTGNYDQLLPGDEVFYNLQVKNISTLPFDFQVLTELAGDLADVVELDLPANNSLSPGMSKNITIGVKLIEGLHADKEGKTGELRIAVKANQQDTSAGFNDEKGTTATFSTENESPGVSIILPVSGDVSGNVQIKATVSDNFGLSSVRYYIDTAGSKLNMSEGPTGTYSANWDTSSVSNGPHTIYIEAVDGINNITNKAVSVTVNN